MKEDSTKSWKHKICKSTLLTAEKFGRSSPIDCWGLIIHGCASHVFAVNGWFVYSLLLACIMERVFLFQIGRSGQFTVTNKVLKVRSAHWQRSVIKSKLQYITKFYYFVSKFLSRKQNCKDEQNLKIFNIFFAYYLIFYTA